ncbi:MAG: D-Ala-D-Ala carboxypeptidase family metallohydrolase [Myxococcota bacterium]
MLVSSWYRDPTANAAAGGHPRSLHQLGLAVDLVGVDRGDEHALWHRFRQVGLVAVEERSHLHVQAFPVSVLPGDLSRTLDV